MNSTSRTTEERATSPEIYNTPSGPIQDILKVLHTVYYLESFEKARPLHILEPAAGSGNVLRELLDWAPPGSCIDTVDVRRECRAITRAVYDQWMEPYIEEGHTTTWRYCTGDFINTKRIQEMFGIIPNGMVIDLIITNPPYNLAWEFLHKCFEYVRPGGLICFLLRQAFPASKTRNAWMINNIPDVYLLPQRVKYLDDEGLPVKNTDSCEYAWHIWHNTPQRRGGFFNILPVRRTIQKVTAKMTEGWI